MTLDFSAEDCEPREVTVDFQRPVHRRDDVDTVIAVGPRWSTKVIRLRPELARLG